MSANVSNKELKREKTGRDTWLFTWTECHLWQICTLHLRNTLPHYESCLLLFFFFFFFFFFFCRYSVDRLSTYINWCIPVNIKCMVVLLHKTPKRSIHCKKTKRMIEDCKYGNPGCVWRHNWSFRRDVVTSLRQRFSTAPAASWHSG